MLTLSFAQNSENVDSLGRWYQSGLREQSSLTFNDIWGYTDSEMNEYGIIGSVEYTHFIDVNDPQNPTQVAQFAAPSRSLWRDFKTYLHYGYGVSDNGGGTLQIFDLSGLPNTVTKVYDSNEFFTNCHNIFIDEENARLYAVGTSRADLVVLDLHPNPAKPTLLANQNNVIEGYIHDIYVRDHIAYASHVYSSKLTVYNLEDLNNIVKLGSVNSDGLNHSSWLTKDGNTFVMADENHGLALKLVNSSDLTSMEVVGTIKSTLESAVSTNSIAHNPFVIGNDHVVISYYHEGVQIYNISDPQNPVRAGYFDTHPENMNYDGYEGSWGVYPFFPSGNIIASDIDSGLFVIRPTFDMGFCREDLYRAKPLPTEETSNIYSTGAISLRSGFHAESGSVFSAKIVPCVTSYAANGNIVESTEAHDFGKPVLKNNDLIINNLNNDKLKVYPNPFTNEFTIILPENRTSFSNKIQLVNSLGQFIQPNFSSCGERCLTVQTEKLPSGIYTVIIQKGREEVLTEKVVKF